MILINSSGSPLWNSQNFTATKLRTSQDSRLLWFLPRKQTSCDQPGSSVSQDMQPRRREGHRLFHSDGGPEVPCDRWLSNLGLELARCWVIVESDARVYLAKLANRDIARSRNHPPSPHDRKHHWNVFELIFLALFKEPIAENADSSPRLLERNKITKERDRVFLRKTEEVSRLRSMSTDSISVRFNFVEFCARWENFALFGRSGGRIRSTVTFYAIEYA